MADEYVAKIMREVDEEEFNSVYAIREALRFIEREERGRPYDVAGFNFWSALWK